MLVNRVLETIASTGHVHRELARRSRAATRPPTIIVPPVMGVRLVDDHGRALWGSSRRVFGGQGVVEVDALRPEGYVSGFTLVPRLYRRDVFGGLVHYLERVYGARLGEDLFVLDYDWRRPLSEGALALARLVARVRGASDDRVDLIGICSGGAVARTFLGGGWRDDSGEVERDPVLGDAPAAVRRVIYMGTSHRGNISGFCYLQEGLRVVPRGKLYTAEHLHARCTSTIDLLPHDGERIFVDAHGARLDHDHLDPATWARLRLFGHERPELPAELARARRNHALVARAAGDHPPSIVIADRHRPTSARVVVDGAKVIIPCSDSADDRSRYPFAFEPGDGVVPAAAMAAAPNLTADGPWWVETSEHAKIATDAHVRPLVVEALLSPIKPAPRERYMWPRNPETRGVVPAEDDDLRVKAEASR